MTPEELKGLITPELEKTKLNLESFLATKATEAAKEAASENLKELKKLLEGLDKLPEGMAPADLKKMKEDLDITVKDFDRFQEQLKAGMYNTKKETKSWQAEFAEKYAEMAEEIKSIIASGGKQKEPLVFDLKAAVTIGNFNTVEAAGSASQYTITENTGIISAIRKRVLTYLSNVSVSNMSKPYALWIEELDEQGTPIFIGEGDQKTFLSVRYEERNAIAKKIAVYGKVTTELMDDQPQLIGYIQNNLMKRADIVTEDQLIDGDNAGDNLKGINEYATSFTGSTLAGTVVSPNDFDVINAIALQVKKAHGQANAVFVEQGVINRMLSNKGSDGHYILPQGVLVDANGNLNVFGIRLIGTNALSTDAFVGGDLSVVNVRFRQGMRIQIGLDGNDFINNKKTILLEQRLVQFVSANDTAVLVKGTFAAAKSTLEATS